MPIPGPHARDGQRSAKGCIERRAIAGALWLSGCMAPADAFPGDLAAAERRVVAAWRTKRVGGSGDRHVVDGGERQIAGGAQMTGEQTQRETAGSRSAGERNGPDHWNGRTTALSPQRDALPSAIPTACPPRCALLPARSIIESLSAPCLTSDMGLGECGGSACAVMRQAEVGQRMAVSACFHARSASGSVKAAVAAA